MAPAGDNLILGAGLACMEAATLGLPFEVVKTFMGRNRKQGTLSSIQYIYGIKGMAGFWDGFTFKMTESALKGPLLLCTKEVVRDVCLGANLPPPLAGLISGAVGGVTQTIVIAPMTFLVTRKVSSTQQHSHASLSPMETIKQHGIRGLYAGAFPIALRQASNWALRQGFVDLFRSFFVTYKYR